MPMYSRDVQPSPDAQLSSPSPRRVNASEGAIKRMFEPDRTREVVRRRIDETETGIFLAPQRVLGMAVRYEQPRAAAEVDAIDDF